MSQIKQILVKPLKLQKTFDAYKNGNENDKKLAYLSFEKTWGAFIAQHFLSKYSDAESLIFALDSENMDLFVDKF